MHLLITAVLIAGAFAIARVATAHPDNEWLANLAAPRQHGGKLPIRELRSGQATRLPAQLA